MYCKLHFRDTKTKNANYLAKSIIVTSRTQTRGFRLQIQGSLNKTNGSSFSLPVFFSFLPPHKHINLFCFKLHLPFDSINKRCVSFLKLYVRRDNICEFTMTSKPPVSFDRNVDIRNFSQWCWRSDPWPRPLPVSGLRRSVLSTSLLKLYLNTEAWESVKNRRRGGRERDHLLYL